MLSALLGAIFSATAVYLTLHAAPGRQRRTAAAAAFAAYEAGAVAYGRVQDGRAASRAARLGHVPAGWLPPRSRDVAPPLLPPPASQGGGGGSLAALAVRMWALPPHGCYSLRGMAVRTEGAVAEATAAAAPSGLSARWRCRGRWWTPPGAFAA